VEVALNSRHRLLAILLAALGLLVLPLLLQGFGNAWVRIADMALLYVLLSLGLNIVVGYAGPAGPGLRGLLRHRRLNVRPAGLAAPERQLPAFAAMFPHGLHTPCGW